ncbi:MAG: hypothetical protein ACI8X5_002026 [Planctomycetota bacterium]|jgi:uncharacterized protein
MSEALVSYSEKLSRLHKSLCELDRLAVAFSGGVDSSVLLHAGLAALSSDCVGVIADSPSLPREELRLACEFAEDLGAELIVVRTDELSNERYVANLGDRCYFCKSALFESMSEWALERGFTALAFGEITDDLLDDRPGAIAAKEFGVLAPLRDAGFSKEDVRRYAREAQLVVAEKPASACLASRLPKGTEVTLERLATVEKAEGCLRERGYRVLRVRHHGQRALVEVGELEIDRAREEREDLISVLQPLGFMTMDLGVYVPPNER